jgi:hypothetical protein
VKQLQQPLAVLEALATPVPCLQGMSIGDLATLLQTAKDDPDHLDALFNAMSDEQVDQMYAAMTDELAARACLPSPIGRWRRWHTLRRPLGTR